MNCGTYTLSGISAACKDSLGGIRKVWLGEYVDDAFTIDASTYTAKPKTDVISDLKVYHFRKNTGSLTETMNVNDNAGNSWTNELSLQFLKQETVKRIEIMGICMNETLAIVRDANGKYWALGVDGPGEALNETSETGVNQTDFNGYNLTISFDSKEMHYEITDASTIEALEALDA